MPNLAASAAINNEVCCGKHNAAVMPALSGRVVAQLLRSDLDQHVD
jgi:hypothetical protein